MGGSTAGRPRIIRWWNTGATTHSLKRHPERETTDLYGPYGAGPNGVAAITVGYHNAGPDPASSADVLACLPSGVPAPIADLTQAQIDALIASVVHAL